MVETMPDHERSHAAGFECSSSCLSRAKFGEVGGNNKQPPARLLSAACVLEEDLEAHSVCFVLLFLVIAAV